jgi:hypothetical protein
LVPFSFLSCLVACTPFGPDFSKLFRVSKDTMSATRAIALPPTLLIRTDEVIE